VARLDGGAIAALLEGSPDQEEGTPGQVVVLDAATGEVRWTAEVVNLHAAVAHVDGRLVVVDGPEMRAYDREGGELWAAPVPGYEGGGPRHSTLVAVGGRVLHAGRGIHAVDPVTGDSELVLESGTVSDVAVAGDHVVVAGVFPLTAVPVGDVVAAT
jgi:outer membrane protein assembly factor BamB